MLTYIFLSSLHLIDDQAFWAVSELISFGPEIVTCLGGFRHNFINLVITFLGGLIPGSSIQFYLGANGFTVIQLSKKVIHVPLNRAWWIFGKQKSSD